MVVSLHKGMDGLAWAGTKNGQFTVRSAYHVAKDKFEKEEGSSSNMHESQLLWKKIWKLKGLGW